MHLNVTKGNHWDEVYLEPRVLNAIP